MEILCKPLGATFYFCIECDRVTPFDGNSHCFVCGCDCPFGELNDPSITQEDSDNDFELNYERIGLVKELPDTHWFHTYYK